MGSQWQPSSSWCCLVQVCWWVCSTPTSCSAVGRAVVQKTRAKKARQLPGIWIALLELEFDCALIALDKEVFVGLVACSLAQDLAFADTSFLSDNSQAEVQDLIHVYFQNGKIVPKCQDHTFKISMYLMFYQKWTQMKGDFLFIPVCLVCSHFFLKNKQEMGYRKQKPFWYSAGSELFLCSRYKKVSKKKVVPSFVNMNFSKVPASCCTMGISVSVLGQANRFTPLPFTSAALSTWGEWNMVLWLILVTLLREDNIPNESSRSLMIFAD